MYPAVAIVELVIMDTVIDMDMLQEQVEKVERLLVPIVSETKRQTAEIDNLLDTYEQAVSSLYCCKCVMLIPLVKYALCVIKMMLSSS